MLRVDRVLMMMMMMMMMRNVYLTHVGHGHMVLNHHPHAHGISRELLSLPSRGCLQRPALPFTDYFTFSTFLCICILLRSAAFPRLMGVSTAAFHSLKLPARP